MNKSLPFISPIFALLLGACGHHDTAKSTQAEEAQVQAELEATMRSYMLQHGGLLAAKYHMSPQIAEAIIWDFQKSQNIVVQALISPAPKSETTTQIIERISTTYQIKPDVVASLIVDELLLDRTDNPPK